MANLVITPASVIAGENASATEGVAGATITAGQALYRDTSDGNKLKLADANGTTPANTFAGIALNGAANNQPIKYVTRDALLTIGATDATQGSIVFLSGTPGGLTIDTADIAGGNVIVVGVMQTDTAMTLAPISGPVAT